MACVVVVDVRQLNVSLGQTMIRVRVGVRVESRSGLTQVPTGTTGSVAVK